MNTTPLSTLPKAAAEGDLPWISEREFDLASWLDEVDLDLHEQMICGPMIEDREA